MNSVSRLPSSFVLRKWRYFLSVLDVDKDGFISRKDHEKIAERAILVGKIDPSSLQAFQVRNKVMQTYEDLYGKAGKPLSYDEAIKSYSENSWDLRRVLGQNSNAFFDMIDFDGDGFIQPSEFRQFFEIFFLDVNGADPVFQCIDLNKDGKLSRGEFATFTEQFFFSTDENHPSKNFYGMLP